MNKRIFLLFIFSISFLSWFLVSCTKTTSVSSSNTFIKTIAHDSDFNAVNCVQLTDGNYLITGNDPLYIRAGWMVKTDVNGNIIWQKRAPSLNTLLSATMAMPGGGFMTAGFSPDISNILYVYVYDNNGNFLYTKSFTLYEYSNIFPLRVIRLNNGNYAFAGSYAYTVKKYVYMLITDNAFNKISLNSYLTQGNGGGGSGPRSMCESADGSINMVGWIYGANSNLPNTSLLRVNQAGVQLSFTTIDETRYQETPSCIANYKGSILVVNSRCDSGSNNYFWIKNDLNIISITSYNYILLSAAMYLDDIDTAGNLLSSMQFTGYTPLGLISSIVQTKDGGYILCGTVGQSSTTSIVSSTKIYVVKLDANLNQQWANTYDTYYPSYGVNICQTNEGGYLICGQQRSFYNHFDMVLIKSDANGNVN